ncbi:MAG: dTMP kinase [Micromonosporaceae bacterium]
MFIAVSGVNGAGKSVFAAALANHLRRHGKDNVVVAPLQSNTRLVRRFSSLPSPDREAWMARERWLLGYLTLSMTRSARQQIKPALDAGRWVVADRWLTDHQINQSYFGASLSESEPLLRFLPVPDLLVWVRTPAALALERAKQSGAGRFGTDPDFHAYAAENYRHLLGDTAVIVDGTAVPDVEAARVAQRLGVDRTASCASEGSQ